MVKNSMLQRTPRLGPVNRRISLALTTAVVPLMLSAGPGFSQSPPVRSSLEEIIVTAQKREQRLIDVPAAISAFSGETLAERGIRNLPEVSTQVPNFSVTYSRGSNSVPSFTLRGVRGDSLVSRLNESSIAIYSDDVFLGDESMLNAALFDIERVEVLRGPQGTLFGKNTTGGLVHFISAKPTEELSGHGSVQYGSSDEVVVESAVSGAITNGVRARLAGKLDRNSGHYRNRYLGAGSDGIERHTGDKEVWGLRGTLDIDLTPRTLLRVVGNYSEDNSQTAPGTTYGTLLPKTTGAGPYSRAQMCSLDRVLNAECISDVQAINPNALPVTPRKSSTGITNLTPEDLAIRGRGRSITATLTHDFDWATLTSVTNYTDNVYSYSFDADSGATPSINIGSNFVAKYSNKAELFSQELRLAGSTDSFDWVTGVFYYTDEKSSVQETDFRTFGFAQWNTGALETTSFAMFGQLDAHISNQVTLAIGGRYTSEKRELTEATTFLMTAAGASGFQDVLAALPNSETENENFTGKMSLMWQPSEQHSFYASYSRGIKGAGFNSGFSPSSPLAVNVDLAGPVGQEVLDAFEIGAKNLFLDRRLSINTAAFYYDFKGKQEQVFSFDNILQSAQQNYLNSGDSRIYGIESEVAFRPTERWDIFLSAGWLDTKITDSDTIVTDSFGVPVPLEGLPLSDVPKWTFSSYLAYHLPVNGVGEFTLQPEVRGVARKNFSITADPLAGDKSHLFVNLRVFWNSEGGQFSAQAFVTNLFNERWLHRPVDVVLGNSGKLASATEGEGRLWGVKLGMKF